MADGRYYGTNVDDVIVPCMYIHTLHTQHHDLHGHCTAVTLVTTVTTVTNVTTITTGTNVPTGGITGQNGIHLSHHILQSVVKGCNDLS